MMRRMPGMILENSIWRAASEGRAVSGRIAGDFFFGFEIFVGNFKGFGLPRSRPRDFHGQASTTMDRVLKQAWIGVEWHAR